MKVAFVTTYNSSDVAAWSGTIFHMRQGLRNASVDVETIDSLRDPYALFFKAKKACVNAFGKNYLRDREALVLSCYARQVERELTRIQPDLVFSPGTKAVAYLRTDKPIVFWADATFDGMVDFYPEFTNLYSATLRQGHQMEQAALSNCRFAIYASEWAARSAIENYKVDSSKVKFVPYGANLTDVPAESEIAALVASRPHWVCRLLFVGVDWYRKGGDRAVAVASRLIQRGINVELHVVGCDPPAGVPAFVIRHGYLSKRDAKQNARIATLYKTSHFLILPSRAEAFGVVIGEANAFGLPAVTTNAGGITSALTNGKNGQAFAAESFVENCTDYIASMLASPEQYRKLCMSSFAEYAERLNWRAAVDSVLDIVKSNARSN